MALYDEIMAGILEKNAGYGYDDDVVEALDARDELLKTAADILETVDEIDYSLGLEKGAGIGRKALLTGLGLGTLGTLGGLFFTPKAIRGWRRNKRQANELNRKIKTLKNRGLFDRAMNMPVY